MAKSILSKLNGPTTTVALAGKALGLSRNKAYQAVAAGEIPSLRFGKRLVIPTASLLKMLGIAEAGTAEPADGKEVA